MAKKKNNITNKKLLVLIGVIVFVFLVIIFLNQRQIFKYQIYQKAIPTIIPTDTPSPSVRGYHSRFLKIRFMAPTGFEISESWNSVTLKSNLGKINIVSSGTNDDTIEGVVFEIEHRGFLVTNKKRFKINGLDVISCNVKSLVSDNPESKGYYFYSAPGAVFSITTGTPELFGELDQIAQSFRYEP